MPLRHDCEINKSVLMWLIYGFKVTVDVHVKNAVSGICTC